MNFVFGNNDPRLQQQILEVCLAPSPREEALVAVDQALEADTLTWQHHRALPMIAKKPALALFSPASRTKILSIYKHTLSRNSLMVHQLARVREGLMQAGFEPLIALKGLSSIAYTRDGMGTRPMADLDILVPRLHERPEDALSVFSKLGYRFRSNNFRSVALISRNEVELDVHWYMHEWAPSQQLVDLVASRAQSQSFLKYHALTPCVEHHLAHTLAHGVLSSDVTFHARWVLDFLSCYMAASELDTARFAEFANLTAVPGRLGLAIDDLIRHVPRSIGVDPGPLNAFRQALVGNSALVGWLHDETPSFGIAGVRKLRRTDRLRKLMLAWWFNPRLACRSLRISYLDYQMRANSFPPLRRREAVKWFTGKVMWGAPRAAYRLLSGR